jgi:small subunit ribosomal protein S6e
MRIVISDPKSGKSFQSEVSKEQEAQIVGKRIGEKLDGGIVGAAGYQLELTGGSDGSGFPMRVDIPGQRKVSALITEGVGFHSKRKGERRRRMTRGNTYSSEIIQVNAKVTTPGATPLDQIFVKAEGEKKEKK